ncbi:MAG: error-prone DNA polymerase [Acidobacteriota bacterium]|nr:error-prone DNA polymerase [Acidobacteriota bacterium]
MYVELHARSAFSFLQGASVPEEYADVAANFDMPAMALLDRDGFYGSPRFFSSMRKLKLRGHTGVELRCTDGGYYPLLAKSRTGYQNLCRLITRTKLRAGKHPRPGHEAAATPEEVAESSEGLICLTGDGDGPLAVAIRKGEGRSCLERLVRTFGQGNVYAELQRHHDRDEEARNQAVIALARSVKVPLVAANGVCHAQPAQRQILDVFTCLHNKVTLAAAGRLLSKNDGRHLKSGAEMAHLFADYPEAIRNTREISAQLTFELSDLGYRFPRYPAPNGQTEFQFLCERTWEAARTRFQDGFENAQTQIERELNVIGKLELAGYFLIVWDIVNFCRREGILVQGRGSAANSAVCYALGITAIDPVNMKLLFERFLSEERGEWPDIDLDLPSGGKRERVIQYVYQRYGKLGAAMTANVITYRGRSAAREVGKVLGFETTTLDRLSSLVPMWGWKDAGNTVYKQFGEAGLDLNHPRVHKFMELVEGIQDMPRHLGQHSGGMVICQGQLDSVVPLEPASMPGRVVVQWDKEDCADLKLIKVDLLGLGMMSVLEDSLVLIRDHYKEEVDLGHLPQDDPETYRTLQKGDTIGMFQVESRAQQATLPRMMPTKFYDLVVQVAIIRPGPIVGKMMHPYLARRQGKEPAACLHSCLQDVLERTLGVPLFQEQLLRMAMVAAGFSGGEAEELRRAMGFKRSQEKMKGLEVRLREGMERKGITGETQTTIVQSITAFALYGFPESHAASFALMAYASAYLKCHYLAAFTCALLNNQPMGFYHPAVLIKDAQRHGLRVLPIDVTKSDWNCTLENPRLRLGLRYVRGVRKEAGECLVRERGIAPFSGIDDLARRVPQLRKDEMSKLAATGALNSLDAAHRRDALWRSSRAAHPVGPLLAEVPESEISAPLKPMTIEERLDADYGGTGVNIGRHPMAHRRAEMDALGVTRAADLANIRSGVPVRIAGCVIVRQRPGTAKGIVFLSIEDETGIANAVVMAEMFDENRLTIVSNRWLLVEGPIQNVDNVIHVRAKRITPLNCGVSVVSHDFH